MFCFDKNIAHRVLLYMSIYLGMTKELYLVNPPNPGNMKGFPSSLLSLDLWVRQRCKDVICEILDEEYTSMRDLEDSLKKKLSGAGETPYIGITATTATYQDALGTAAVIKKIKPNAKIILGGHHVTGQERIILQSHSDIDFVVTKQGEKALESILNNNINAAGVWSREKEPALEYGLPLNADELSTLDARKFNSEFAFRSTQFKESNLITARGCPMGCAFCAVAKEKIVPQYPKLVVEQIDYLVKEAKKRGLEKTIAIQDNFFAQDKKRAQEIASLLIDYQKKTGEKLDWNMQTRVDQFNDEDFVSLMAKAGCSAAYFGIENFDERILKLMKKAHNIQNYMNDTQKAIQNCLKYGIKPQIDFQVGTFGFDKTGKIIREDFETEKINELALKKIGKISELYGMKPLVFPSLSVVYPATEFYQSMRKMGVPKDIFETFTSYEREDSNYRSNLNGYFAHGNGGIPLGVLYLGSLVSGKIDLDNAQIQRVKNYVDRLRKIEGIVVHDFKNEVREK